MSCARAKWAQGTPADLRSTGRQPTFATRQSSDPLSCDSSAGCGGHRRRLYGGRQGGSATRRVRRRSTRKRPAAIARAAAERSAAGGAFLHRLCVRWREERAVRRRRRRRTASTPMAAPSLPAKRPSARQTRSTSFCAHPGSTAPTATNFLRSMLRLAASRERIDVVADQHGCPTAAADLAQAVARVLPIIIGNDGALGDVSSGRRRRDELARLR